MKTVKINWTKNERMNLFGAEVEYVNKDTNIITSFRKSGKDFDKMKKEVFEEIGTYEKLTEKYFINKNGKMNKVKNF